MKQKYRKIKQIIETDSFKAVSKAVVIQMLINREMEAEAVSK